jgi:6-pyruvoyltetrahydropterin/6-carboxytetrahydropterin synthase
MRVRLTRKVEFSSGHRYWRTDLDEKENRALFGKWASKFNHGHNYALEVTAEGDIDPENGMVVNIKTIDDEIRREIVDVFDGKSINDEVEGFQSKAPSLENLLHHIRCTLGDRVAGADLVALRLDETPTLWAEIQRKNNWKMTLTRSYEFSASHRLYSRNLSNEENDRLFGKCANPAGHGHNYVLEVTLSGETNPETGMMADLCAIDSAVNNLVVDRYDHKNFNADLPEFEGKVTTTENVIQQIWDSLKDKLPAKLERVKLYETPRNSFEVSAE